MPPVGAFIVDVLDGRADRRLPQRRKHSLSRCPQSDLNCWGDCPAGGGRAAAHCEAFYAKDSALLHALNAFAWSAIELLATYTVPDDIATRNPYCRYGRKPQPDGGMNPRARSAGMWLGGGLSSAAADAPKPFNELGRAKRRDLI